MKPNTQNRIYNFLLVLVSITISLLIAELILRKMTFRNELVVGTTRTTKAELYGWAMPPNTEMPFVNPDTRERSSCLTNSQGWKDIEHTFDKPAGIITILIIGDSYTYGMVPLEDLYTRQIERLLQQRGIVNVEVISIGVGSWGTDQELEVLMQEGVKYAPDIVIHQFCENDLGNNLQPRQGMKVNEMNKIYLKKPFRYELKNGILQKIDLRPDTHDKKISAKTQIKDFLLKSTLIYYVNIFRKRFTSYLDSRFITMSSNYKKNDPGDKRLINERNQENQNAKDVSKTPQSQQNNNSTSWWVKFPMNPTPPDFLYQVDNGSSHQHPGWKLLEALLVEMKTVSQNHHAQFIVFSESGDNGLRRWNLEWNRIQTDGQSDFIMWDGKKYPIDTKRPLKELDKLCQRNKITLIKPKREYTRYHNNPHTNKEGNKRMAEDIVEFLLSWEYFTNMAIY